MERIRSFADIAAARIAGNILVSLEHFLELAHIAVVVDIAADMAWAD